MRLGIKTTEWKRWFAWFPVRISVGTYLWLQTVQRRKVFEEVVVAGAYVRWKSLGYEYRP
jgi:hypothetical protein